MMEAAMMARFSSARDMNAEHSGGTARCWEETGIGLAYQRAPEAGERVVSCLA